MYAWALTSIPMVRKLGAPPWCEYMSAHARAASLVCEYMSALIRRKMGTGVLAHEGVALRQGTGVLASEGEAPLQGTYVLARTAAPMLHLHIAYSPPPPTLGI